MEIGDYIYLILALALGLISAIRKKKGKNEQAEEFQDEEQQGPRPRSNPLDEIFGDLVLSEEEEISYEQEPVETYMEPEPQMQPEIQKKQTEANPYEEYLKRSNQNHETISQKLSVISEKKKDEDKRKTSSMKQSIKSEFDLKKAVIYSEILNRKY